MCGIAGIAGPGARAALIRKMTRTLAHRGPDDEGLFHAKKHPVSLGNRRLSIIDLPGGHQPLGNEDESIWIVFNGEIYNHAQLRSELGKRHLFKTQSDTEVLVHLYEERGVAFLDDLIGMFALAIYDARDGSVFLARDRLGKKPLVYFIDKNRLLFASEIKALLEDPSVPRRLDRTALELYLAYLYVPAPYTMFRAIQKLPPGHWARWKDGKLDIHRYWSPQPRPIQDRDHEVRRLLDESVRLRLVSDVPVASFLSGGIDSTIITTIAASHVRKLQTISVGFEEATHNELPFAKQVASRLGTRHTEIVVKPDAVSLVQVMADSYDEPFGDSSALPTFILCREAAKHVKVALAGDGGDECFAGYMRHVAMAKLGLARKTPKSVAGLLAALLPRARQPSRTVDRMSKMLTMLDHPPAEIYRTLVTFLSDQERSKLGCDGRSGLVRSYLRNLFEGDDAVNAATRVDLLSYLPEDLLVKVDIASMANSLEVRAPFLDHRLVEVALGIPGSVKIRGLTPKHYLRTLYADMIPDELRKRPKKGFSIPLKAWLAQDLAPLVEGALLSKTSRVSHLLRAHEVRSLYQRQQKGQADYAEVIWAFLMLELWMQRFRITG